MKLSILFFALTLGLASASYAKATLITEQFQNTTSCKTSAGETLTITKYKGGATRNWPGYKIEVEAELTTSNGTEKFQGEEAYGKLHLFDEQQQPVGLVMKEEFFQGRCTRAACVELTYVHAILTLPSSQVLHFTCGQ